MLLCLLYKCVYVSYVGLCVCLNGGNKIIMRNKLNYKTLIKTILYDAKSCSSFFLCLYLEIFFASFRHH